MHDYSDEKKKEKNVKAKKYYQANKKNMSRRIVKVL